MGLKSVRRRSDQRTLRARTRKTRSRRALLCTEFRFSTCSRKCRACAKSTAKLLIIGGLVGRLFVAVLSLRVRGANTCKGAARRRAEPVLHVLVYRGPEAVCPPELPIELLGLDNERGALVSLSWRHSDLTPLTHQLVLALPHLLVSDLLRSGCEVQAAHHTPFADSTRPVKSEARRTCHCPDRERESARARESYWEPRLLYNGGSPALHTLRIT